MKVLRYQFSRSFNLLNSINSTTVTEKQFQLKLLIKRPINVVYLRVLKKNWILNRAPKFLEEP
jgi:hypothetical protein